MPNQRLSMFEKEKICEFIFEVRYEPSPIILDKRGMWAKELTKKLNLPHWTITDNRIDVYDLLGPPDNATERCFISFRNAGWTSKTNKNHNTFLENCSRLINFWFSEKEIFPNNEAHLTRVGVKFKYGDEFRGSFSELLDVYKQKYIRPTDSISDIYNAEITDIGGFLVLNDEDFKIQTMSGPMDIEQIKNKKFFPFIEEAPKTILYFEIDSSTEPNKFVHFKALETTVKELVQRNWSSHNRLLNILDAS